jgi:prolyl-tRNA synthetase
MTRFHRWSDLLIPTLREAPAGAETAGHKLLLRSGYLRQLTPGVHSYLFLGQRCLSKITNNVRDEMSQIGQEFGLPAADEKQAWEILTDIARKDLRSYKQLPQVWYQIGAQNGDEPCAKSGPLRASQSLVASSCSFALDAAGLDDSWQKHFEAYRRILQRCGLNYKPVEADGADDATRAQALVFVSSDGDDRIVQCPQCSYAANLETAISAIDPVDDLPAEGNGTPLLVHTPAVKTIDDLAQYLKVSPKNNMKTLAYMAEVSVSKSSEPRQQAVVVFLRGDHQLNEAKLSKAIAGQRFRPMQAEEILQVFGSPAGFLGPIELTIADHEAGSPGTIVFVDTALQGRRNLITGANKEDFHLKNVTPGKDFQPTAYLDLRTVNAGEKCSKCGTNLTVDAAIKIATVSKLDSRCAEKSGARVLDQHGKEVAPAIGRYAIDIERILAVTVEQNRDGDGFCLPPPIAPFDVIVTPISVRDDQAMTAATDLAHSLASANLDVLLDDRDERPGVKFKDADLVGIPFRINVGKKVTEGTVEVVNRSTHQMRDASISAIAEYMQQIVRPTP